MPFRALAARLRAHRLIEAVQEEQHEKALAELVALRAEAVEHDWTEVRFLASMGQVVHAFVHGPDDAGLWAGLDALVAEAEDLEAPALSALALALRAVAASRRGDLDAMFADAGRAVAVVDDETLPALDRCTALVICGAAYNSASLWELADELYDRAAALAPLCEERLQDNAIAVNRVLVRLEWATALLEIGEDADAVHQLLRAAGAVRLALRAPALPALWRLDVEACGDLLPLVRHAFRDLTEDGPAGLSVGQQLRLLDRRRGQLRAAGDVEVLPLLDALTALSLLRLGYEREAGRLVQDLTDVASTSSGARSFPLWVRAEVLTAGQDHEGAAAMAAYARMVARARWRARQGVLAAARSRIAGERIRAEHARLSRDVMLDPLTGLANRRAFELWRTHQPAEPLPTALLLLDLDRFKAVNDAHGHAVGDEVLRQLGRLLSRHVRVDDLALRLGGDEFAVILEARESSVPGAALESLDGAARRLSRTLQAGVRDTDWGLLAPGLEIGASIGFAAATLGTDGQRADALYREADTLLYAAKSSRTAMR